MAQTVVILFSRLLQTPAVVEVVGDLLSQGHQVVLAAAVVAILSAL
jgi:hypothetical protein